MGMKLQKFALFRTAIGHCTIVWGDRGIAGLELPAATKARTQTRMAERFPEAQQAAPPAEIARAVDGIIALLDGAASLPSDLPLDLGHLSPFYRQVYQAAREIPAGTTRSYGEIAAQLGRPGAARAVGQALKRNPLPLLVPCHRVLAANGQLGGFSGGRGLATKRRLLEIERALATQRSQNGLFSGDSCLPFDTTVAVEHLRRADRTLSPLIEQVGPLRLRVKQTASLFLALAEAIVYQQLTGKAASTIFTRFLELFTQTPSGPTATNVQRLSAEVLRSVGLSRAKVLSLQDLAQRCAAGQLPGLQDLYDMNDQSIINCLTTVRGIGRWTVEMLLIFRLGRPDVLPAADYGVRKGFARAYGCDLPSPKDLERHGDKWKPYRTVASWYLWRAAELPPGPLTNASVCRNIGRSE